MLPGIHQRRVVTIYKKNGKVFFFNNSYHARGELRLKLLNFEKVKSMRWPNVLIVSK